MNIITMQTRNNSFNDAQKKKTVRYEEILKCLNRPKTAKEIAVELYDDGIIPSSERNYTAPRLTELEDKDIVRVIGKKKCKWTGKMVAVYQKTEQIEKMRRECENMNHIPRINWKEN